MTAPDAHRTGDSRSALGAGAPDAEQPEALADGSRNPPAAPRLLAVPDLGGFHELRIWAESFEDTQRARIACVNRMERGGVAPDLFVGQIAALNTAEHQMKLGMVRCYRRVVPAGVRAWQDDTFGMGAHLVARLLGALGHPRIATPYHWQGDGADRVLTADAPFERTVRQLWSYCGHGDPSRRRRKGMTVDEAYGLGSPRCKMLVHLLAEASIKCRVEPKPAPIAVASAVGPTPSPDQPEASAFAKVLPAGREDIPAGQSRREANSSPVSADRRRYRVTYEQRRAHTAATRPDWTDGHSHNDALRIVGKHLLADLWEAS